MEVREAPRPFQVTTQGFLPHFEARLPKRQPISPETARLGPLFAGCDEGKAEGPAMAPGVVIEPCSALATPVRAPTEQARRGSVGGAIQPTAAVRTEPIGLLRGLLWSGALGFRLKPRPARLAAQGELALATVQVKRNDLLDADLELVWEHSDKAAMSRAAAWLGRVQRPLAPTRSGRGEPGAAAGLFFWRKWFDNRLRSVR